MAIRAAAVFLSAGPARPQLPAGIAAKLLVALRDLRGALIAHVEY